METMIEIPPPRMPLTAEERQAERQRIIAENGIDLEREAPGFFDLEIVNAVQYPHESLRESHASGCAEPWTSQVVASLLIASNQRNVVEVGSFTGYTSAWLCLALERMGGGTFTAVDIDPDRAEMAKERLDALGLEKVDYRVVVADSLQFLATLPAESIGFVWLDGNHEHYHVAQEICLLYPRMKKGGIITGHDVFGSCDLRKEFKHFGGYAIDLPRLGRAGGIGILQIPK